jgi:AP-1-like factor
MTSPQSDNTNASTTEHTSRTRKLTPHAAWEILQSHPLFARGALDISLVCERLKQLARSDDVTGGPMFDEDEVRAAVEEIVRDGEDDLE